MDRVNSIKKILFQVSKPGQYTGGEYGSIIKQNKQNLTVAISYPDLYEIGMSNTAVKLLYNLLNSLENVTCERVFAPAQDMEAVLRMQNISLFSLETWKPLNEFDIIAFSLGYELTATNLLNILDLGKIPYLREQRTNKAPLIIAGGPAVSNPWPLAQFIDFAFIGEAEDFIQSYFPQLATMKKTGASGQDFYELIDSHPSIWNPERKEKIVKKSIFTGFPENTYNTGFPVANIKLVQDHGNVEIMRGCRNGCRFCHAGIVYRPVRMKQPECIDFEVARQIFDCGYREITLSSLSTGDYQHIEQLVDFLTRKYSPFGVSFALPSLRINSVSLDILAGISEVRKSGLTFAVETPEATWQLGLNKEVSLTKTAQLLHTAEQKGWRLAKFYFMIGLPLYDVDETEQIIAYLKEVRKYTKMKLNVNISTFVPKAHTPFQWAGQLNEETAVRRIHRIKNELKNFGFKIVYHSPFASFLEGVMARGDERIGNLINEAFKQGARLDAWEEFIDWKLWKAIIAEQGTQLVTEINSEKKIGSPLPWDNIDMGVKKEYFITEYQKAKVNQLTDPCQPGCIEHCGICRNQNRVRMDVSFDKLQVNEIKVKIDTESITEEVTRLLVSFSKQEMAIYLSHLNIMSIFERAFIRAGYLVKFTEGFNPKPKMEFAQPLSLGIGSDEELCLVEITNFNSCDVFCKNLNNALPAGLQICRIAILKPYQIGKKKISLSSLYWGSDFRITCQENPALTTYLFQKIQEQYAEIFRDALQVYNLNNQELKISWKAVNKKGYNVIHFLETVLSEKPFNAGITINRLATLAQDGNGQPVSYFDVIR